MHAFRDALDSSYTQDALPILCCQQLSYPQMWASFGTDRLLCEFRPATLLEARDFVKRANFPLSARRAGHCGIVFGDCGFLQWYL